MLNGPSLSYFTIVLILKTLLFLFWGMGINIKCQFQYFSFFLVINFIGWEKLVATIRYFTGFLLVIYTDPRRPRDAPFELGLAEERRPERMDCSRAF
jgi:hypothetical protein